MDASRLPGETCVFTLTTENASFSPADPDATPVAAVYADGVLDAGVAVAVANVTTGFYRLTLTVPDDYAAGTTVTVRVTAAFAGNPVAAVAAEFAVAAPVGNEVAAAVADTVIEAGVTPSAQLVNDSGAELSAITLRQAMAVMLAALAGKGTGLNTAAPTYHPAAKPNADPRLVTEAADGLGNRPLVNVRVPD